MSEYWLISAPVDKSNQQIWERMNTVTEKASLSNNYKFPIPELKVGTLDSLVGLSDELGKLDTFVEGIVKKLAQYTADIMEDSKDKAQENLLANGVDLHRYVTHFQWDMAKYPIKQSLQNITEVIAKQISQIDTDLKSRAMTYNNTKGNLQNLERKAVVTNRPGRPFWGTSPVATTLAHPGGPVQGQYRLLGTASTITETITPVGHLSGSWVTFWCVRHTCCSISGGGRNSRGSGRLEDCPIPGTSCSPDRGSLLTRTLADIVNKEDFVVDSEYLTTLLAFVPKSNYSNWQKTYESLADMVVPRSTKMIIEDIEGALFTVTLFKKTVDEFKIRARENKYGLPVNFQAMLLQPNKKSMKRLRDVLNALFKHLDEVAAASTVDANMDIPGLNVNQQDYYAYVYFKIDIDLFNFK
ncbi:V-type proton ATPase subunit C 1-B-like isoform X3 [Scyliorhinus torazame]|uniref:V-type proton ATPase subunit C 1-B-like isoform X3 n=1 Tax=Scyliorhinus torazame TaxID=75743 RepID=UPI003B5B2BB6